MKKKDLVKKIKFDRHLLKKFKEAIYHYDMIKEGDNILLGFSGGKDSTALALLLKYFQLTTNIKFSFQTVVIDYGMDTEDYQKQVENLKKFDIETNIFKTEIYEMYKKTINPDSSLCSFFSRMRRGKLTEYARENNFNKIALGHHLDDAAESLFMGILKNGKIRSLPPIYKNKHKQIIIRPLVFSREKWLSKFCRKNNFETLGDEMCPGICLGKMPVARLKTKNLLKQLENEDSAVFNSILHALKSIDEHSLLEKSKLPFFKKKKKWIFFKK